MNKPLPQLSVLIPAFEAEKYLEDAIRSVLAQGDKDLEIIVVDDGSTDRSAEIAAGFGEPVRIERQKHAGAAAARNHAFRLARGKYLAFLDADDLWDEAKLHLQWSAIETSPETQMFFGHVRQFLSPDLPAADLPRFRVTDRPIPGQVPGTLLIRRESFEKVGLFEEKWKAGEFLDWYGRAREAGLRELVLPETLLHRRIHGMNSMIREKDSQQDYLKLLKAKLDRQKLAGRASSE